MSSRRPANVASRGNIGLDFTRASPETRDALTWLAKTGKGEVALCIVISNDVSHDGTARDRVDEICVSRIPFQVRAGCIEFENERRRAEGRLYDMIFTSATCLRGVAISLVFYDAAGKQKLVLGLPMGCDPVIASGARAQVPNPGVVADELTRALADTAKGASDDDEFEQVFEATVTSHDGSITARVKFDMVGVHFRADDVPPVCELPIVGPIDMNFPEDSTIYDLVGSTRVIAMDAARLHDLEIRGL